VMTTVVPLMSWVMRSPWSRLSRGVGANPERSFNVWRAYTLDHDEGIAPRIPDAAAL